MTGIDRVQPTIFAMQVALAATMKSYGVVPGAVIGHSLGEVAAAVVAGALSLEDGVRVICRRARLCLRLAGGGAMASVELPAQQVLSQLADRGINDVVVAVVASPTSTVIGGATEPVRELVAGWEQREIMAREVAVDVASHSPQVDPILDELTEVLADLDPMSPTIPYYSATSIDPREEPYCDADYWVENLGRWCDSARRCRPRWRTATESSPNCRRTRCSSGPSSRPPRAWRHRWPRWPACAVSNRCRTDCAACWPTCTPLDPRWTSRCSIPPDASWMSRCRPGPTVN